MKKGYRFLSAVAAAAVAASAMCFSVGAVSQEDNLLTNPGASKGLKGWKDPDKVWVTADSYKDVESNDGKFFMPKGLKGKKGLSTSIYQDLPLKNCAGKKAVLEGYLRSVDDENRDNMILKLEFLDDKDKSLGWGSASSKWSTSWKSFSVEKDVPEGAAKARVSLIVEYNTGDYVDGCFDDISLTIDGVKKSGSGSGKTTEKKAVKEYSYVVKKGQKLKVSSIFNGVDKDKIKWSSSDKKIVKVDSSGSITGKKKGNAVVTAKYGDEKVKINVKVV